MGKQKSEFILEKLYQNKLTHRVAHGCPVLSMSRLLTKTVLPLFILTATPVATALPPLLNWP